MNINIENLPPEPALSLLKGEDFLIPRLVVNFDIVEGGMIPYKYISLIKNLL